MRCRSFDGLHLQIDAGRAVEPRRDRLDLLRRSACSSGVRNANVFGLLARGDDRLGQLDRAGAALAEAVVRHDGLGAGLDARAPCTIAISAGVSVGKLLIATTHGSPYCRTIWMCAARLSAPLRERVEILGREVLERLPAVRLRRAHAGDEHRRARREPAGAADDVAELLKPEVAGEARLGDDVVGQLQRDAVGEDRVVGVRDVAERAGMHERRLALERLHEVRLDRVLHDHGHRAAGLEHVGRDGLAVVGADATTMRPSRRRRSFRSLRQREHRHHLRRGGDDELVLARDAVRLAAEADDACSAARGRSCRPCAAT